MSQVRVLSMIAVMFALSSLSGSAQSIFFNFTDGSSVSYGIDQVRSTDFADENMRLFLWDGTSYSWDRADIANYNFNGLSTGREENPIVALPQLSIYPNPSKGEVVISFGSEGTEAVTVGVYDLKGELVRLVHVGKFASGEQSVTWDGLDTNGQPVSNGSYVCRVTQGHLAASKQVVIQR